jgi:predicted TIM-barrel fold metal-dependent hydrolase
MTNIAIRVLLVISVSAPVWAQRPPERVIDMHVHAYPANWVRNVLGARAGPGDRLPDPPNPITGKRSGAETDAQLRSAILEAMKRHHIVKAIASGPLNIVYQWKEAAPDVVIGSPLFPIPKLAPYPSPEQLRADYSSGRLGALGEVTAIYDGFSPSDMKFDEYYRIAEQMGIPVGIHTGIGIPEASYGCCPGFRIGLANPLNVEDLVVRHPKIKLYIMHAGYPYLDAALALMNAYPGVYADLAAIDWLLPRAEFQAYLQKLMRAGMGKRLMFGTDEIVWPDAFGVAIDNINSADFLTPAEKSDIFYNNAARFLGLEKGNDKAAGN